MTLADRSPGSGEDDGAASLGASRLAYWIACGEDGAAASLVRRLRASDDAKETVPGVRAATLEERDLSVCVGRALVVAQAHDRPQATLGIVLRAQSADGAILVVDALAGLTAELRRQARLLSVLQVRSVVFAIAALHRVAEPARHFAGLAAELAAFAQHLGLAVLACVPGEDVASVGEAARWYRGPSLPAVLAMHRIDAAASHSSPDVAVSGASGHPRAAAHQFEATVIWFASEPMLPGRAYLARNPETITAASLGPPKYRVAIDSGEHLAARTLGRDDIGVCNVHLEREIAYDAYADNRSTGTLLIVDAQTQSVLGAALIHFALRRSQNVRWQAIEVDKRAHAQLNGHRACVVWFTGLPGAGKSTLANLVQKRLHAMRVHTCLLDGDNVRHGLNQDLGFTAADRVENVRRVAEVARLMVDAGLVVLVSFISPFRAERRFARSLVGPGEFCEVFVDVPLDVAEARDRKGLYAKARRGELVNFTGIDSPYERPERPEVVVETPRTAPEAGASAVIEELFRMGVIAPSPRT